MSSGRRITLALVALVLLAVIGWLATDLTGHGTRSGHGDRAPVSTSVPISPSVPRPAGASG